MVEDQIRRRFSITGKVQGVGFRNFTVKTVRTLNDVTGWVKNESDGSVTVVAEGAPGELRTLEEELTKGSSFARVDNVSRTEQSPTGEFSTFKVRY